MRRAGEARAFWVRAVLLATLAIGLVSAGGCAIVRRVPRETVAPAGEVVLPTFRCADTYLLRAEINGKGPFLLMVDTGAAGTLLTPAAAAQLEDAIQPTIFPMVGATGKWVTAKRSVRIDSLKAGGLELRGFDAVVVELTGFAHAMGGTLDGIIGYPAFRDVVLTFDYPRGEVRAGGEGVAEGPRTEKLHDRFAPSIKMDLQGTRRTVVLDTGSSGSLSLPKSDALKYVQRPRVVGTVLALGGIDLRWEGRLAGDLELGGHALREPIVDSSKSLPLLGSDIMRFFVVRFDQKARLAEFVRAETEPVTFPSTFGIGVGGMPEPGGYRVLHVLEGLPARAAGLKVGDLIETIDGRKVMDLFCDQHALYTEPGRAVLEVVRDGERIKMGVDVVVMVP
jgi:hypothetical protein